MLGTADGVALVGAVQEALAALPIGEGRARLHAVMRIAAGDEALVDHHLGALKPASTSP